MLIHLHYIYKVYGRHRAGLSACSPEARLMVGPSGATAAIPKPGSRFCLRLISKYQGETINKSIGSLHFHNILFMRKGDNS
jgi:hypothetical protein